jgi:aspartyl aminopeptidase
MDLDNFNQALFEFLDASPTPFHAVASQIDLLEKAGFIRLYEADAWAMVPGKSYYVTRNGSSLIAFNYGSQPLVNTGIRMLGAHTDSPCLKVKPNAEIIDQSCLKLGVEVYGGALLNPWFDRDLSLAGRVVYRGKAVQKQANENGETLIPITSVFIKSSLIDFRRPVAMIPSLAIHLDKEANKNRSVNPQTDIPPILMAVEQDESVDLKTILKVQLKKQYDSLDIDEIIDSELVFYDTCRAASIGVNNDFIASSRLDNLLSCFIATRSIIAISEQGKVLGSSLIVCNDHEEVGSASASGAQGTFLKSVLQRLTRSNEELTRVIDQSMLISADNAHGIHPNYADKHDSRHGPILNKGPVIKVNANQRYASNSHTIAVFKFLAGQLDIPVQSFVVRSDIGCGSTIGPITASEIGIKTVDIGVPTFAMHSIRELCGNKDGYYLYKIIKHFFDFKQSIKLDVVS